MDFSHIRTDAPCNDPIRFVCSTTGERERVRQRGKSCNTTIARIARLPFPLSRSSIMDIFLRVFCTVASCNSRVHPPPLPLPLPPHSHLFSRSFSLLSRVTRPSRAGPPRTTGFNIYGTSTCGPFHLVRSRSTSPPPLPSRRNSLRLLLFAMRS